MKVGKIYRPIESKRDAFRDNDDNNFEILNLIDANGGSFEVRNVTSHASSGNDYVDEVRMANGQHFDSQSNDENYFELTEDEFRFFEEVDSFSEGSAPPGVVSMIIEVNQQNFREMIALIKNSFKK